MRQNLKLKFIKNVIRKVKSDNLFYSRYYLRYKNKY